MTTSLPLGKEQICDERLRSFWHRIVEQSYSPQQALGLLGILTRGRRPKFVRAQ
jgi:hypothetical protein